MLTESTLYADELAPGDKVANGGLFEHITDIEYGTDASVTLHFSDEGFMICKPDTKVRALIWV
jgi:hypothetical protein